MEDWYKGDLFFSVVTPAQAAVASHVDYSNGLVTGPLASSYPPLNSSLTIQQQNGLLLFFKIFYLFLERGEGKKKKRETSMCDCLPSAPYWGPGLQPRHVPRLGIKMVALCFTGLR